jgi:hypothetical protein
MNDIKLIEPYSDDLMRWDEVNKRYYITEAALVANGTNLRAKLTANRAADANAIINRILKQATVMIYGYIHGFNTNNEAQDNIIARVPSMRGIMYNALLFQAEYIAQRGILTRSLNAETRKLGVDESAKDELNRVIDELGIPITYAGRYTNGFS